MKNWAKNINAKLPAILTGRVARPKVDLSLSGDTCKNCQAPLYSRYCAACGQRHYTGKNPWWEFMEDITDQMISPESKLYRTFFHLLALPGIMTRNYFRGMRASYAPPIRLFLISLVAFFGALEVLNVAMLKLSMVANESVFTEEDKASALEDINQRIATAQEQGQDDRVITILEGVREDIQIREVSESGGFLDIEGASFKFVPLIQMFAPITEEEGDEAEVTPEMVDSFFEIADPVQEAGIASDFLRRVQNGFVRAAEDPSRLNNALNIWLPRVMVIFVPMFALFMRFFYWHKEHFILNQMVFSLHFHTALFFFLTFFLVAQSIFGEMVGQLGTTLLTFGFPIFMFLSLKNAYGDGWFRTFGKFAVISSFYALGVSTMLAGVFLVGLAEV